MSFANEVSWLKRGEGDSIIISMEMNKNTILLTVISVVAIFGFLGIAYMVTNQTAKPDTNVYEELKKPSQTDHVKWSKANKHVLVEFSDLQCPACKGFHDIIRDKIEKNPQNKAVMDNVTFVYKQYPLPSLHKNAVNAVYAAEAAGMQGKFYEMSGLMFDGQADWAEKNDPKPYFMELAKKLKLDTKKWEADMNSKEIKDKLAADQALGDKVGVQATPTFFLDGKKVDVNTFDEFVVLLQDTAKQ